MSGINVIQTGKDVGVFFNSWVTYVVRPYMGTTHPNGIGVPKLKCDVQLKSGGA